MKSVSDRIIDRLPAGGSTIVAAFGSSYDRLTTDNACVLLIDHQIGPLWELEFAETRRRVVELAGDAKRLGVPTIITAIGVDTLGPIIPELTAAHENAPHVVRDIVNAWDDPVIRDQVESTRCTKLIIAGSAADVGVLLCARSAIAAGYAVYVPIDACAHFTHPSSTWLSNAGAIVTTAALVTSEIGGAKGGPRRSGRTQAAPIKLAAFEAHDWR
ncbi:MAG TPA: isochorismatase family protein [Gemmatimonadaceae bacterium]|nr:isochorismatase family protein [Gemmatimonadaceae bacterium]